MPVMGTNDPNVEIESIDGERVTYRDLTSGERWVEIGPCNRCGLCLDPDDPDVEWDAHVRVGEPGAAHDRLYQIRPHYVTRPEWQSKAARLAQEFGVTGCSLQFEILSDGD